MSPLFAQLQSSALACALLFSSVPLASEPKPGMTAEQFVTEAAEKNPEFVARVRTDLEALRAAVSTSSPDALVDRYGELIRLTRTEEGYRPEQEYERALAYAEMAEIEWVDESLSDRSITREAYEKFFSVGAPYADAEFVEAAANLPITCVTLVAAALTLWGGYRLQAYWRNSLRKLPGQNPLTYKPGIVWLVGMMGAFSIGLGAFSAGRCIPSLGTRRDRTSPGLGR